MKNGKMTNGTHSYQTLLQMLEPRPITSEFQYNAVVTQMNELIDKGDLSPAEEDMLTLLGTLVMAYEDEHYPNEQFELRGVDLIKGLMAEGNLGEADLLPIFQTQGTVTSVLHGTQPLTPEDLDKLAAFFGLPSTLFEIAPAKEFA